MTNRPIAVVNTLERKSLKDTGFSLSDNDINTYMQREYHVPDRWIKCVIRLYTSFFFQDMKLFKHISIRCEDIRAKKKCEKTDIFLWKITS